MFRAPQAPVDSVVRITSVFVAFAAVGERVVDAIAPPRAQIAGWGFFSECLSARDANTSSLPVDVAAVAAG